MEIFPSISTGIYHYPVEQPVSIAVKAVSDFRVRNSDRIESVRFALFSENVLTAYEKAIRENRMILIRKREVC